MPRAPRKCPHPGCEQRIRDRRYCPDHTPVNWSYKNTRGGTAEHKRWAATVLKRCGHRCEIRGPKCTIIATQADHIIPDAEGGTYSLDNGQGACGPCHSDKTKQEAHRGLRRAYGLNPPF